MVVEPWEGEGLPAELVLSPDERRICLRPPGGMGSGPRGRLGRLPAAGAADGAAAGLVLGGALLPKAIG